MLKERIVTALCIILFVFLVVFFIPSFYAAGIAVLISGLGAWEWSKMGFANDAASRLLYVLLVMMGSAFLIPIAPDLGVGFFILGVAFWLAVTAWMLTREHTFQTSQDGFSVPVLLAGLFAIVVTIVSLGWLFASPVGSSFFLYLLGIPIVADSAAYFAGKRFGRVKLAAQISPGKTIEGALGGLLAVVLYAVLIGASFSDLFSISTLIVASVIAALFSILGDLFESALKRRSGMKDSGRLLPGHGGILDRIDSLLAAAPVFVVCLMLGG